ncbi:hypothetical protein DICVIV_07595 [Dictyocaulus viviparus]|uniref:Uncharacterized protein n=1 Tax=Dictyocaulus viviparus TaxID=29172 RepID=A0A0D8XNZ6_DICVI|nr:hypothetical protein DICVIV_07595 [Dictyocaulus viviparus]
MKMLYDTPKGTKFFETFFLDVYEFFFDHVTLEDLDTKSVTISVFHHGGAKLGKDLLIGEATIPLREIQELNTRKEVKIIEEIKPEAHKLMLAISLCKVAVSIGKYFDQ